jgi:hypothetical protein
MLTTDVFGKSAMTLRSASIFLSGSPILTASW